MIKEEWEAIGSVFPGFVEADVSMVTTNQALLHPPQGPADSDPGPGQQPPAQAQSRVLLPGAAKADP